MVSERKSVLISSVLPNSWAFGKLPKYANQYLEMAAIAEHEGMDFKFLLPKKGSWAHKRSILASFLGKKFPESAVFISGRKEIPYLKALNYPRDILQVFGDRVYTPTWNFAISNELVSQLGRSDLSLTDSFIGEGGLSVRAKKVVVGAELPLMDLAQYWNNVRREGYRVFELPIPTWKAKSHGETGRRLRRSMYNGHLDTEMNIVFTKQDNLLLLVNSDFNDVFRAEVDDLVKNLDAKKFVVSNSNEIYVRAVNFVSLPSGRLIVNERCSETIGFLKNNLGNDMIYEIAVPKHKMTHDGPLRCRTLII